MQKVAISIGDLNGVGIEIALKAHEKIKKIVNPIYCINKKMLKKAAKLLNTEIPDDFETFEVEGDFEINPGKIDEKAGKYSFDSFISAINLAKEKKVDAICTLPINKESWSKAGIKYKGHTEVLRDIFKKEKLIQFFSDFYRSTGFEKVGVLGLNPHAGDGGVLGDEEIKEILPAIIETNEMLNKEIFYGPLVPDIAFTAKKGVFIAMYHDQGLAPLKALYFDESINVSLNLPILRTSVDHGTAFDIAYKGIAKTKSYENAIKYILNHKN
ncbi:4-hydroxythreonine-4-phosphate dehydrogenase PdxA [Caminibacter pacificus]